MLGRREILRFVVSFFSAIAVGACTAEAPPEQVAEPGPSARPNYTKTRRCSGSEC